MARAFAPGALQVSAREGWGIEELLSAVESVLRKALLAVQVLIPYTEGSLRSRVFSQGSVQWYKEEEEGTRMLAFVPAGLAETLQAYRSG